MKPPPLNVENQTVFFHSSEKMELESESIQLIVTSPPYWNVKNYGGEQLGFGQSYEDYVDSMNNVWKECIRVLKPNGKIAINFQPLPIESKKSGFNRRVIKNLMFDVEVFMRKSDLYLSSMYYWDKSDYINNVSWGSYPKPTNINSNTSFEQIFVWVKRGPTRKIDKEILNRNLLEKEEWRHWAVRCIWDDISPIIKINSRGEDRFGHAAPFPEDIPYRLIRMHTVEGETVLDPFLGSGTTLKICRILNRIGFGYEINDAYHDLIKKRILEDWTPPKIERQYKVIGNESFYNIMNQVIELTIEETKKTKSVQDIKSKVMKQLYKKCPNPLSKSYIKKIIESLEKNENYE
ncbi:MAG: DNA-methyltransferase [Candidatus Helarchaeota archaeon]